MDTDQELRELRARVRAMEKRLESRSELKRDQGEDPYVPVSRRGFMGGVIGAAAGLGGATALTGTAGATAQASRPAPGTSRPSGTRSFTQNSNHGSIVAGPGELQEVIDQHASSGSHGRITRTRIQLDSRQTYSSDTVSFPSELKQGITLDLNGVDFVVTEDVDVFHFRPAAYLKNGRIKYLDAGKEYSSTIFDIDGKRGDMRTANSVRMHDVSTLGAPGNGGTVFYVDGTENPIAGHVYESVFIDNPGDCAIRMRCYAGGAWTNSNYWYNTVVHGGRVLIDLYSEPGGDGRNPVKGNYFQGMFHPSDPQSEWLATLGGSRLCASNKFDLLPQWDLQRCSEGIVHLTGNVEKNVFYDSQQSDIPNAGWIENRKWVNEAADTNMWINDVHGRLY